MANNFTEIVYKILGRALETLREQVPGPRLVTSDFSSEVRQKGSTIDLFVPTPSSAVAITPGATDPTAVDVNGDVIPLELDQWRGCEPFVVSDKEMGEIAAESRKVPSMLEEGVRAIANEMNSYLLQKAAQGTFAAVGTAGTTPFGSDYSVLTAARKAIKNNAGSVDNLKAILDFDAEEAALNLSDFGDVDKAGDSGIKLQGRLGTKLGIELFGSAGVYTHDTDGPTGWLINSASVAVHDKSVAIDTGSNNPKAGDIFTVAGDTQSYVVTSYAASTMGFRPAAKVAWANNAAITFSESTDHVCNLVFNSAAFGFAQRQLGDSAASENVFQMTDPVTGMSIRLEIRRQNKRDLWQLDVLYGGECIRGEHACRVMG